MAEFFFSAGLFAIKAFVVLLIFVLCVLTIATALSRRQMRSEAHLTIKKLNDELQRHREALEDALLDDAAHGALMKQRKAADKAKHKAAKQRVKQTQSAESASLSPPDASTPESASVALGAELQRRVFVLDFVGDIQASALQPLRHELSSILAIARKEDEVVVRLESGGGAVHAYGLAASQLQRVRDKGVRLTVCVDKVAASGGYMMACVADQLIAAPFAVLGSIGVVAQLPNLHRFLDKHDIDFELLTSGKYKRNLTIFGRNTQEGREKFQEELDVTHQLFQEFVKQHRPALDMASVATGETWYGARAIALNLIDSIRTSDDYLCAACESADVLEVKFEEPQPLPRRLLKGVELAFVSALERVFGVNRAL